VFFLKWTPDSCACVVRCERPSKEGTFIIQCREHNTTLETYAHNIRFKTNEASREIERLKPKFQRR